MRQIGKLCMIGVLPLIFSSFAEAQADTYPDPLYGTITGSTAASYPQVVTFDEEFLFGLPNGPSDGGSVAGNWFAGLNGSSRSELVRYDPTSSTWGDYMGSFTPSEPGVGVWEIPSGEETYLAPWYMTSQDPFPSSPSGAVYFEASFRYPTQTFEGTGFCVSDSTTTSAPTSGSMWNPSTDGILQIWNDSGTGLGLRLYLFGTEYSLESSPYDFSADGTDLLVRMEIVPSGSTYDYAVAITDNKGHTFSTSASDESFYPNVIWIGSGWINTGYEQWTSLQMHHIKVWYPSS